MAQLDFFTVHIVNVGLEGRVVSHQAVTAQSHVLPLVNPRGGLFVHVALLERDQSPSAGDLRQLLLREVGLVQGPH